MSRQCMLSGKKGLIGNRVSHSKRRTKVCLLPNIQYKKIYAPSLGKFVKIRISTQALRTVNKIGLEAYCAKVGILLS